MAKTVPLDSATLEWARRLFAGYYASALVPPPDSLREREFAAFSFAEATTMRRHTALPTTEEFSRFLKEFVPRHVYYSSAHYRLPAEPSMGAKGWHGADLIFDLDSDHLRGAAELNYAGQLSLVKRRFVALVDGFLVRDFGIDPDSISLAFSGGRGYHAHVHDDEFRYLLSPERRELVDYILGNGVDPESAVQRAVEDVSAGRSMGAAEAGDPGPARGAPAHRIELYPEDAPGWKGRTATAVFDALRDWEVQGWKSAAREMTDAGIAPARARRWAKHLVEGGWGERIRQTRTLDVFGSESPDAFLTHVIRRVQVNVQGETDAPVTTDIHRLIRLPGSLHGGTGLRVVPLRRDELEQFDPFRDALLGAEAVTGTTAVTFLSDVEFPFPDGGLRRKAGSFDEVPTAQALFLVLRGEAALRPSRAA